MKKIIVLILLVLSSLGLYSQQWCATGAEWYYTYFNDFTTIGYWHIYLNGDTVIKNRTCNILESKITNSDYTVTIMPNIYTYLSNDTVYYYNNGNFYILYRFDAIKGDSWQTRIPCEILGYDISFFSDSMITFTVDTVKPMIINDSIYDVIYLHSSNESWYMPSYTKKIGALIFMFPVWGWGWLDPVPFRELRCYHDTTMSYSYNINYPCDTVMTSINDLEDINRITIYPNPSNDIVYIKSDYPIYDIKIYNFYGEMVFNRSNFSICDLKIDTKDFSKGFYSIRFNYSININKHENKNQKTYKFIKL